MNTAFSRVLRLSPSTIVILAGITSLFIFGALLTSPPENTSELYAIAVIATFAFPFILNIYYVLSYLTFSKSHGLNNSIVVLGSIILELVLYIYTLFSTILVEHLLPVLIGIVLLRIIRSVLLSLDWARIEEKSNSSPYPFLYNFAMFSWSLYGIWTFKKRVDALQKVGR